MKLLPVALLTLVVVGVADARDLDNRYANSPKKFWYESLEIPEAARKRMGVFYKSCCDRGDLVKTKFRVGVTGDDIWEYLDGESWKVIPSDIILEQPSLDEEPRLFKRIATGEPLCFVRPNGGI